MLVNFKKEYSPDWEFNLAWELVSDEPEYGYDEVSKEYGLCYNTKLIGYVLVRKLEISNDPNDIPAIDVWIELSNM